MQVWVLMSQGRQAGAVGQSDQLVAPAARVRRALEREARAHHWA